MESTTSVGIDLAKNFFQVRGIGHSYAIPGRLQSTCPWPVARKPARGLTVRRGKSPAFGGAFSHSGRISVLGRMFALSVAEPERTEADREQSQ